MLGYLLRRNAASQSSTSLNELATGQVTTAPVGVSATDSLLNASSRAANDSSLHGVLQPNSAHVLDRMTDDLKYKLFACKNLSVTTKSVSNETVRLLVAEENGQMMNKDSYRVALDHTTITNPAIERIRAKELKEYIFGSPVQITESPQTDKLRCIPNSGLVMITRIFFYDSGANRIAICLCVSVALLPAISEAWAQVTQWLNIAQEIIISILTQQLYQKDPDCKEQDILITEGSCQSRFLLPKDIKTEYPSEFEQLLRLLQTKLIFCLRSLSEIPRIFPFRPTVKGFVETWFRDVLGWIEIKDGPRLKFLPILLAKVVLDYREQLAQTEYNKIVVISGNMVIANQLIFIISGLLKPKCRFIHSDTKIEVKKVPSSHLISQDAFSVADNSTSDLATVTTALTNTTITATATPSETSNIQSTSKGWEIPKQKGAHNLASISSNESLAEVIQPSSSVKSNGSSLHHLYSSLSSQHGSYGSWFNKRPLTSQWAQKSPSTASNDSWERLSSLQRTASNSSLYQTRNGPVMTMTTPQASPSISEYEEYPWFGTPSTETFSTTPGKSLGTVGTVPGISTTTAAASSSARKRIGNAVPGLGKSSIEYATMDRTFQRVSTERLVCEWFDTICGHQIAFDSSTSVTPEDASRAAVLEVNMFELQGLATKEPFRELLPRYTNYLPHYNEWYKLQAFPIGTETESRIVHSTKRNLTMSRNCTRTLLISLASREIKEVIVKKVYTEETGSQPKYVQKSKKIYSSGKLNSSSSGGGSTELNACLVVIEDLIKSAAGLLKESGAMDEEQKEEELYKLFNTIAQYVLH